MAAGDDDVRPVTNFPPSLWGDQFLHCDFDPQIMEKYNSEIQILKKEVRDQLTAPGIQMIDAMNLIETLERLGVAYHFENEIANKLQEIFDLKTNYEDEAYDLYTVSLHFRILRQHGYDISSDIFRRWMDQNGKFPDFIKNDVRGLLSLYEATHLRIHGETILEDAVVYATTNLKSLEQNLGSSALQKQVVHGLFQPFHLGIPRIEARSFISIYEEDELKNESLLRFAKIDYNFLQILHKKELQEVSRWWKELDLISKHNYSKDRFVECFYWGMGAHYEPQYSRSRIMFTKCMALASIMDDTYDTYGTIEELDAFTKAIERWDIAEIDQLPEYMKELYKAILELYRQFEDELVKEGRSYGIKYAMDALKELARSYNIEAKWIIRGQFPTFEEYLKNAFITCTYYYHMMVALMGMKFATKKEFECLHQKTEILIASLTICRLMDDICSYKVEKERGQILTGIECYMKENNLTKEEAMTKLHERATNAWKDINEGCLKLSFYSKDVVKIIINLSRVMDAAFKNKVDGYIEPKVNVKPHILALLVDQIKL